MNSSIADSFDSLIPHLKARDVTLIAVSGAPIEKLLAYRERMGWSFNWASSYESEFNADLGFSTSLEQTREAIEPMLDQLPAVAFRNAKVAGTDIYGYLTELFGFTIFRLEDGTVYQTYSTTGRGVEFLMPYYGFLDRAPKGRDEGEEWQLWIRRHDEYDSTSVPPECRRVAIPGARARRLTLAEGDERSRPRHGSASPAGLRAGRG